MVDRGELTAKSEAERQERDITRVLAEEYTLLHGAPPGGKKLDKLADIYSAIHDLRNGGDPQPRTALCLSGGGIRSASFGLGVLQSFAQRGLLDRFHYLSTVSGGGYIGGWLSTWRKTAEVTAQARRPPGHNQVESEINQRTDALGRERAELKGLRANSNYLTPQLGVMSADTWALAALYLRNLLLNWLVFLPMIVAVVLVPLIVLHVTQAAHHWTGGVHHVFLVIAGLLLVLSLFTSVRGRIAHTRDHRVGQGEFLVLGLLPMYVAAMLICLYAVGDYRSDGNATDLWWGKLTIAKTTVVGAAIYGLVWLGTVGLYAREDVFKPKRLWTLAAWAAAGALGGALIGWGCLLATEYGHAHSRLLVVLGVGWIAASFFFAESIYLGLTSYARRGDSDREWLARSSGWFVAMTVGWGALSTLVLYAPDIHGYSAHVFWSLPAIGAAAGVTAAGVGSSALTLASLVSSRKGESFSMTTILSVASLIFLVTMVIVVAAGTTKLVDPFVDWLTPCLPKTAFGYALSKEDYTSLALVVAMLAAGLAVVLASIPVNVNRFSSHAMYRNRLARAFLGSARGAETWKSDSRDPFTGFDSSDNMQMSQLLVPADRPRLFHVINMALNVVAGTDNAWQERKAEPFVVTPKIAGNEYVGFRDTAHYGSATGGITLGTCMAISGAAASPNSGYHSSPLIGFIMTLFNVRLGWWLGNPRYPAKARREGPWFGIFQVIKELFGQTDDKSTYVYLSDGGHFENLGLYEMVRRRCHMIVVSDGGCDPQCAFEDLGNAVRKIRIDLGVRIDFASIEIRPRGSNTNSPYCAIGRIYYPELSDDEAGYVLYIKPGFRDDGKEPADVSAYALANAAFPHETTADQFFSESQMEAYRTLGRYIVDTILGPKGTDDDSAPTITLRPYWKHLSEYIAQFDRQKAAGKV